MWLAYVALASYDLCVDIVSYAPSTYTDDQLFVMADRKARPDKNTKKVDRTYSPIYSNASRIYSEHILARPVMCNDNAAITYAILIRFDLCEQYRRCSRLCV